jgi:hypothetical protein
MDLQNGKRENLEAKFPDYDHIPVTRVASDEALCRLAYTSEAAFSIR